MIKKKRQILVLILLSVLITLPVAVNGCADTTDGLAPAPGQVPAQIIEDINVDEAYTLIQENEDNADFVILDVRTPQEYAEGNIAQALNINFKSDTFRDDVDKLDKEATYLVYCRSGVRSAGARDVMAELGFTEVYNMEGGILEWEAEGLPVVK